MITRRSVLQFPLVLLLGPLARHARAQEAAPALVARYRDSSRRGRPFAKDPCVVWFRGRYWMYYSLPPYEDERRTQGWGIGIATSPDCRHWTKAGEMAAAASYETAGFCAPGAVVIRGELHLFYQTYGLAKSDAVCHAVSSDGLTFDRNPSNPVLRAKGAWNCGRAIDAEPFVDGDRLLLYAATRDPEFRRQMVFGAEAPLGSRFRPEDLRQLADRPLLPPELPWEKDCIEAPTVIRHGGKLFMFYAGGYNNEPQQIGCAVSSDGVNWKRVSEKPLLAHGAPGTWNSSESGHPGVVRLRDGRTFLFFQGNPDKGTTWELAAIELGWRSGRPVLK